MSNERRCRVVIEFADGETHKVHPDGFALLAEKFGGDFRGSFAEKCETVKRASGNIKSIRKEFG